jgi:hypothetical protein
VYIKVPHPLAWNNFFPQELESHQTEAPKRKTAIHPTLSLKGNGPPPKSTTRILIGGREGRGEGRKEGRKRGG